MKEYSSIILVTLLSVSTMVSCKKEAKDYTAFIKDKIWWGMLTNAGGQAEYYSVHFKTDNSLLWNQLAGEYPGKWVINGKRLTMDFATLGVQIKADITDDNKLTNIVTNNSNIVNSGELLENTNIPLNNTFWKGTLPVNNSSLFEMSFMPGGNVQIKSAGFIGANGTFPYIQSGAGSVIRFSNGGGSF